MSVLIYNKIPHEQDIYITPPIKITGIPKKRPLSIYLPPDYHELPDTTYPIAYFFDGQNIFGDEGTFAGGWHLHKILAQRYANGQTVPIVIGIHHGLNRDEELCPWPAEPGQTPRGDALLDWIKTTLHPRVFQTFRIQNDPLHTLIAGSSLGGELALYAFFRFQGLFFGQALAMSPSMWVGEGAIFDYISNSHFLAPNSRLYIDCGVLEDLEEEEEEEEEPSMLEDFLSLIELLAIKGLEEGEDFMGYLDYEGGHHEYAWSSRLPMALDFLYAKK